jgi:hypothetical protein
MIDLEAQYRRWAELMDRDASGGALSPDELAFCERFAAEHPACAREQELLSELADLDAAPSVESRALVDATLARLAEEAAQVESMELSRLRGRPRLPRAWLLSGSAVAAVALALAIAMPRNNELAKVAPPPANQPTAARVELVYASGDVRVNGVRLPTGSAVLLAEGSRVTVGEGGGACLAMDPQIDVCARADSELVLSRTSGTWRRVDLVRGKVGVQLAPQPAGYHFSVVAADVWSTAVGTAFTVANDGERGVRTTVMHGKVNVGSDHDSEHTREQLISAHERAEVVSKRARVTAVGRGDESSEWALLRPAALWQDRVSATLVALGEPAGAQVVLDDQLIGIAPLATLLPAGKHRLQVRVQGRSVLDRELISEAGQTAVIRYDAPAVVAQAEAAVAPAQAEPKTASARQRRALARTASAPEPEVSAADMLREAHRLMRAQSFDAAAKQYDALRISYPESPEANTVLVSLAELQLDRLRRPALALDNLDRYLANGSGGLGEEARQVRIRALRALGEREREEDAIEEFLGMHPRSFRAPVLQRRLAELQAAR